MLAGYSVCMDTPDDSHAIVVEHLSRTRRSLRVAVITETYPPEVNGVALTAQRFVEGLRQRDHDILLVRPRQKAEPAGVSAEGADALLTRGVAIPRYPGLQMGLPASRLLTGLWRRERPDVVHVLTEGPLGWSAVAAARKLMLPVVSDFRTNFHAYSQHYGIGWLGKPILAYLKKFHNRTWCTLVPTESLRAELAARGFRNLRVVARGVDTMLFHPGRRDAALRQRWGAGPDDPVMLYVGRLAPEKNIDAILSAFAAAREANPATRLVLTGEGPSAGQIRARCPEAIMTGTLRGEALAACYASADIFLFPSLTETFGNVTLEALASGLAVVAFDYAAAADHIRHQYSGWLAPKGDAEAFLAMARESVLNASNWRRVGANGCSEMRLQSWGVVVGQLEELLLLAVQQATGTPGMHEAP